MNTKSPASMDLDKDLKCALQRLYEAAWAIAENAERLGQPPPQVEAFLQIFTEAFEYFSKLDWINIYTLPGNYSRLAGSLEALNEKHAASMQRLNDEQQRLVDDFVEGGHAIVTAVMEADNPQVALASYINKSLDAYNELTDDMSVQAQTIATLQSAYADWYQQTFASMASKSESE